MILIAVLIGIHLGLINAGIVVSLRLIRVAVLIVIRLPLVIARIVGTRLVIVRIGIVVTISVVRRIVAGVRGSVSEVIGRSPRPRPPRIESATKDHPRSVDEGAPVTIPPMIAVTVPIAMPIARTTGEDVSLPVTTNMIVCVPEIVCVPAIVSIPELG